jgi:hypothetical protein
MPKASACASLADRYLARKQSPAVDMPLMLWAVLCWSEAGSSLLYGCVLFIWLHCSKQALGLSGRFS